MARPDFDLMWANFPDHQLYPTLETLHKFIGGELANNIDVPGFGPTGNTCAVRMSRAMNYGVFPVSSKLVHSLELNVMRGSDRKLYLFRVRELKKYLHNALGVRPSSVTKDFGTAFSGKRGIVAFDVTGWSDASGHVALWDGNSFREAHDDYRGLVDDLATPQKEAQTVKMSLWEL